MINKFDHPEIVWMLAHWRASVLLSAVLLVLAVLALIVRWWDQKDDEAQVANYYGRARR